MTLVEVENTCADCGITFLHAQPRPEGWVCADCANAAVARNAAVAGRFVPPKPRFRLEWADDDTAKIWADLPGKSDHGDWPAAGRHIATLRWNGIEWLFIRRDESGGGYPGDLIDVDPEQRAHLAAVANENALDRLKRPEPINEALDAELELRRREFRDETRELAELGAKGKARVWWHYHFS